MNILCAIFVSYLTIHTTKSTSCLGTNGLGIWIKVANGTIPPNGVIAGYNAVDDPLYICRFQGVSGKLSTKSYRKCLSIIHGEPASSSEYEILTGVPSSVWVPVRGLEFPCNQLQTGSINGVPTYSSRAYNNGELSVGQVSRGKSYIGDGETILPVDQFEILTATYVTISPNNVVYGLNGNYLSFRLRGARETVVWLGISSTFNFRVTIGFLMNSLSAIGTTDSPSEAILSTKNILNSTEYGGFWIITSTSNDIEFGREGDVKPILSFHHSDVHKINSVRFGTSGDGSSYIIPYLPRWN